VGIYDQSTIYQIQQANDIVDVVSEYVSLKRKGREMVGLCPFHDDHRPSLYVNSSKQIFKCFACGAGGDVFKFVQMRENLSFGQAIERLAERAGIQLKPRQRQARTSTEGPALEPNRLAKLNAWAAEFFQRNLAEPEKGKQARQYLAERGFKPETIAKWGLGLAPSSPNALLAAAATKKIPTQWLQQAGLATAQNQDKFVNRLIFPIRDVTGRVIGFGGRSLDGLGAKYINSPSTTLFDKSNCLFGLDHARAKIAETQTAVVVEGYTDCIMAHQFGCDNVVATLGTSFTPGQARLLKRYAKTVVLVFDSDTAGTEAANRALDVCLSQRLDIRLAFVPQGKDPCEFLLAAGKERFEQLVDAAVEVLQFKWNRLIEKFAAEQTFASQRAALEEYLQSIAISLAAGQLRPLEIGLIINRLSKITGLAAEQLGDELNRRITQAKRAAQQQAQNSPQIHLDLGQGLFAAAQRELLEVLLNEPAAFAQVKEKVKPQWFDVPILKQAAEVVFQKLSETPDASLQQILAAVESPQLSSCLVQLQQQGQQKGNFQPRLAAALQLIERHRDLPPAAPGAEPEMQRQFLRELTQKLSDENRHSIGMV